MISYPWSQPQPTSSQEAYQNAVERLKQKLDQFVCGVLRNARETKSFRKGNWAAVGDDLVQTSLLSLGPISLKI